MNPSIINREKILTKFNLNNKLYNTEVDNVADTVNNIEDRNILKTNKRDLTENLEIKITNDVRKIPMKILAKLPSNLKFYKLCCDNYKYHITDVTISNKPSFNSQKLIHICIYNIISNNRNPPFLLFLLYKDIDFKFPNFKTDKNIFETAEIKLNYIYENYTTKPSFMSYKETSNNIYLFYELKEDYKLMHLKKESKWWWATISEIVNFRKIMNTNIHKTVYNLFYKEPVLGLLFNKLGNKYFTGQVVYFGENENYISFISILGLPKESPFSNLGPYYYFYNYYGAGRRAIWTQSRKEEIKNNEIITRNEFGVHKRGGIVRFIIFGNDIKYFLNRETDKEDSSNISIEFAKEKPFIKETLKIRDVDGNWTLNYDMAYIGSTYIKVPEKDYKPRRLIIQWAIRDFYQQFPLSFHYVNTDEFSKITDKDTAVNLPYEYLKYDIE